MTDLVRETPLHSWHVEHEARMAHFGGYEMPLWYPTGPKAEHQSVIGRAGLFDTSHMAGITISGSGSEALLQTCFSKNLAACLGPSKGPLVTGRCVYGVFLDPAGGVIDDALVYRLGPERYLIVVNASMGPAITHHLTHHAGPVDIIDLTDRLGKIDLQGPDAVRILSRILENPERVFAAMPYFSFKGGCRTLPSDTEPVAVDGDLPIMLSRTGYTGEFGFELFADPDRIVRLWNLLLKAGAEFGLMTCGLAARDSLRTGAVLPLSHQDIGPWPFVNHPWRFALPYTDDGSGFTKDFIGAEALKNAVDATYTFPFTGFDPRKVAADNDAIVLTSDGDAIGVVTTCATDMAIDRRQGKVVSLAEVDRHVDSNIRGLSCGFVRVDRPLAYGDLIVLKSGKRELKVEVTADIRPARTARYALAKMR
jgi:aminomethyltransferase